MDHPLPVEILCKILFSVVAPHTLFINYSDERFKYTERELVTREDVENLPAFEYSWNGLEDRISFLTWPVDFHHNISAYRVHQQRAMACILVCKSFAAILTPILYQCVILSTSTQAQALVVTLGNANLATLIKTVIICPKPLFYPNRELVNNVVDSCPNLRAFHNFSTYHSIGHLPDANTDDSTFPVNPTRLTHDPFSIARVRPTSTIWDSLGFLEFTSPACHLENNLPELQVSVPNLVSLKMELSVKTLTMLQECSMPRLRQLCLTRSRIRAYAGKESTVFLKKHGKGLIQLEYPDVLWGASRGEALGDICPNLKELIVDPIHCIAGGASLDPPPVQGAPKHPGVSEIGLRHVASSHMGISDVVNTYFELLINTDSFPMLASVHDMAWNRDTRRVQANWMFINGLCEERGVSFRDWTGSVIV